MGQREEMAYLCIHLGGCGEKAVVANAGSCRDAVGDLALHHENGAGEASGAPGGEKLQKDVRGDVVGKISDDVCRFALGDEIAKVGLEDVGFDDAYVWLVAEAEGEFGCQGAVEFEGDQGAAATGEDLGDRPVTRTDFDYRALADISERIGDGVASCVIHKKVLSEFWLPFHLHPIV